MNPLLILGASTRAAAFSAIRAGFHPICGDMFADADLRSHAHTILSVPDYPRHLVQAVRDLPATTPWIYTGALENSPSEVDCICQHLPLWGNLGDVLRRCRDPWSCAAVMQRAGLAALELRPSNEPPPRDGTWLLKPLKSAAGRAISIWRAETPAPAEPHYFQRFVAGTPISGAYLGGDGWTRLLGVSRQLIGVPGLHAPEFGYCGSMFTGEGLVTPATQRVIRQVGEVMGRAFGLRGLFGIDFMDDGQVAWMTEVNPRYTASMELIEYAHQQPLLKWHQRACEGPLDARQMDEWQSASNVCVAKGILYADRNGRAPDLTQWIPRTISLQELPELADIPTASSEIATGFPVFTCLGTGTDPQALQQDLVNRAQDLWRRFQHS